MTWLLSLLKLIPGVSGLVEGLGKNLVDAYTAKLTAEGSKEAKRAELAAKELDLQVVEANLAAKQKELTIGRWYEPEHLFAYIMVFYFGKVVVWDAALGLGVTDPLKGNVAMWAGMVFTFWLGRRGIENVVKIWKL